MYKMLSAILASTFLIFAPLSAVADEAEMKAQVAEISAGLVARLPMDQKIVLKALSPEESGLPEDFLRKLTSDLEAALLVASNFEINLANRLSTEELWSEATEFGDADFEKLYAASKADIMLMLTPRATGEGLEISITAYQLLGDDAGQVLASSGSVVLAMDLEATLGINVITITEQVSTILGEIEAISRMGGLISQPSTYAEFYHNARLYQQKGEVGLALNNLEAALKIAPFPFIDPVEDFVNLAISQYGANAGQFLEQRMRGAISEDLYEYAYWLLVPQSNAISVASFSDVDKPFLPLVALWLSQNVKGLEERIRQGDANGEVVYSDLFLLLEAGRYVLSEISSGGLQAYYIDKSRVKDIIDFNSLRNLINELNRVEYAFFETDYAYGTGGNYVNYTDCFLQLEVERCKKIVGPDQFIGGVPGFPWLMDVEMSDQLFLKELVSSDLPRMKSLDFSKIFPASPDGDNYEMNVPLSSTIGASSIERRLGPCGTNINLNDDSHKPLDRVTLIETSNFTEAVVGENLGVHPITAALDRLIFADICLEAQRAAELEASSEGVRFLDSAPSSLFYYNPTNFGGLNGISAAGKIHGIKGFLITDDVDTSREIILSYSLDETWAVAGGVISNPVYGAVDISRDGSYISPLGAQFPTAQNFDGYEWLSYTALPNGWLYIPGIVQGAVGLNMPRFLSVNYYDQTGRRQVVSNSYLSTRGINGVYIGAYGPGMFVGHYAPSSRFGAAVSPVCANRGLFSTECEVFSDQNNFRDSICAGTLCTSGIGLEAISSFSLIRERLYGGILGDNLSDDRGELTEQNLALESTEKSWRLLSTFAGPYHLGDEEVGSWSPLIGQCFSFELPSIAQGGKVEVVFEPYGMERAFFRFSDGSIFEFDPQTVISGNRPNYWGEEMGVAFDVPSGFAPEIVSICANLIDPSDIDDFMFRNLQVWSFH